MFNFEKILENSVVVLLIFIFLIGFNEVLHFICDYFDAPTFIKTKMWAMVTVGMIKGLWTSKGTE